MSTQTTTARRDGDWSPEPEVLFAPQAANILRYLSVRQSSDALERFVDTDNSDVARAIRVIEPLVLRHRLPPQDDVVVLRQWEGRVDELTDGGFIASLSERDGRDPDHTAEFSVEEVSPSDRVLVVPGAVFYWTIGYRDRVTGQRSRESLIRFRRLPGWTSREAAEVRARADAVARELGWHAD